MPDPLHKLRTFIQSHGPLSVAQYMDFCLADPEMGYYRTCNPLGRNGDFVTAPEVSQMFGELIGLWLLNLWEMRGHSTQINLIELGPGRGTLMADLLRAVKIRPRFLETIRLHLLEINPYLQKQQEDHLRHVHATWYQDIDSLLKACQGAPCFIIANEFFDVLSVNQYVYQDTWVERLITYNTTKEQFEFFLASLSTDLSDVLNQYSPPQVDDIVEISPKRTRLFNQLLGHLQQTTGHMLLIDYGYEQPLYGDTLQALKNHQSCYVLAEPGYCDLTSHVNFWQLLQEGNNFPDFDFKLSTQGDFLREQGIRIRVAQLCRSKSTEQQEIIRGSADRLISPQGMGQLFKVLEVHHKFVT